MKTLNSIFVWCIIVKFGYSAILDSNNNKNNNKSTTNLNLQKFEEHQQKEKTQCEYYNSTCFSDKENNKSR